MKAFEEWYKKHAREHPWRSNKEFIKDAWKAALEWALIHSPVEYEHKACVSNQGQGMDGYTMLANFRRMDTKIKEELNS